MEQVGEIPRRYGVPVVWSAIDRRKFARDHPGDTAAEHLTDAYSVSTLSCFLQTESYMRGLGESAEVASVVLEQNQELQRRLPELLSFMNNASDGEGLEENWREYLPFTKIIDGPSAQPKSMSSILQVADYCAFAIKRRLQKSRDAGRLTSVIAPQLLLYKEAASSKDTALWNPIFMPQAWGNKKHKFEDGKFSLAAE